MKTLKKIKPEDCIFFDIETARVQKELEIDSPLFDAWAWKKRKEKVTDNEELQKTYADESGLFAEFSKVICLVVGAIHKGNLHLKEFKNESEKELLSDFNQFLSVMSVKKKNMKLVGFFNSGFDTPFVYKRMIINGIDPHDALDTFDDKPWLINTNVDLAVLWKGSGFDRASLLATCTALGIPSPKDGVKAYEVGDVYWNDGKEGFDRIVKYCGEDVLATARLFLKLRLDDNPDIEIYEGPEEEEAPPTVLEELASGAPLSKERKKAIEEVFESLEAKDYPGSLTVIKALSVSKKSKVTKAFYESLNKKYGPITA